MCAHINNQYLPWHEWPAGGLMEQSWQAQLLELERHLNASTAEWKVGKLYIGCLFWLQSELERCLDASTAEWKVREQRPCC